jgi:CheY-like chemotaxis protein
MPGADGFAVLKWIRERQDPLRRVPVVMLTTSHDLAEVKRAYDLGANSFLVKPSEFSDLSRMVADLLSYWLSHNRVSWPAAA